MIRLARSNGRFTWLARATVIAVIVLSAIHTRPAVGRYSQCVEPSDVLNPTNPGHDAFATSKADDIFVGRVIGVEGEIREPIVVNSGSTYHYPQAILTVEISETVKGSLTGVVTIVAPAWEPGLCVARLFDPPFHTPPLAQDDVALFLTEVRPISNEDRTKRNVLISPDDGYFQIVDDAERIALVERFRAATQATPVAVPEGGTPVASPIPTS